MPHGDQDRRGPDLDRRARPRSPPTSPPLGLDARVFYGLAVGTDAAQRRTWCRTTCCRSARSTPVTGRPTTFALPSTAVRCRPGQSLYLMATPISDTFVRHGQPPAGADHARQHGGEPPRRQALTSLPSRDAQPTRTPHRTLIALASATALDGRAGLGREPDGSTGTTAQRAAADLRRRPRRARPAASRGRSASTDVWTTLQAYPIAPGVSFEQFTLTGVRGVTRGQLVRIDPATPGVGLDLVSGRNVASRHVVADMMDPDAVVGRQRRLLRHPRHRGAAGRGQGPAARDPQRRRERLEQRLLGRCAPASPTSATSTPTRWSGSGASSTHDRQLARRCGPARSASTPRSGARSRSTAWSTANAAACGWSWSATAGSCRTGRGSPARSGARPGAGRPGRGRRAAGAVPGRPAAHRRRVALRGRRDGPHRQHVPPARRRPRGERRRRPAPAHRDRHRPRHRPAAAAGRRRPPGPQPRLHDEGAGRLFQQLGAEDALNLDGGGSSTMVGRSSTGRWRCSTRPPTATLGRSPTGSRSPTSAPSRSADRAGPAPARRSSSAAKHSTLGDGHLHGGDRSTPRVARVDLDLGRASRTRSRRPRRTAPGLRAPRSRRPRPGPAAAASSVSNCAHELLRPRRRRPAGRRPRSPSPPAAVSVIVSTSSSSRPAPSLGPSLSRRVVPAGCVDAGSLAVVAGVVVTAGGQQRDRGSDQQERGQD